MIEFLDHWQTLIGAFAAGVLGFAAAIWTIRRTLQSESRRALKELNSIKKALGAEIRQYAHQALNGHRVCSHLAQGTGNFRALDLRNAARFPEPVIFPNIADRLGLVGDEAHWIVFFFGQLQVFREAREDISNLPNPNSVPPANAEFAAEGLRIACEAAVHVLPFTRSGDYYAAQDARFAKAVAEARRQWHPENQLKFTTPLS